jgi:hypothetical protein
MKNIPAIAALFLSVRVRIAYGDQFRVRAPHVSFRVRKNIIAHQRVVGEFTSNFSATH